METRSRAEVSIAATDNNDESAPQPRKSATERPGSAPVTREEGTAARLTAGSALDAVAKKRRDAMRISKPRIVEQIERELSEMREEESRKRAPPSNNLDLQSQVT